MPLEDLTTEGRGDIFTEDDRRMHTAKMAERTFGVPVEELGELVMVEGRARVNVQYKGKSYQLRWSRPSRGGAQWFIDEDETPIKLSGGNNPLARLRQLLESRS